MRSVKYYVIVIGLPYSVGAYAETVLITRANSGIGPEFAKQHAALGWRVIATHRPDATPETLSELVSQYPNVQAERMDVTSREEIYALGARSA